MCPDHVVWEVGSSTAAVLGGSRRKGLMLELLCPDPDFFYIFKVLNCIVYVFSRECRVCALL